MEHKFFFAIDSSSINMLPSLGLFKSIPCPLYPNCSRNPCFYSHKTQRIDEDRPLVQVKRQKLATEQAKKTQPVASSSRPVPIIPTLIPEGKSIMHFLRYSRK
jgi:hypothetical protein